MADEALAAMETLDEEMLPTKREREMQSSCPTTSFTVPAPHGMHERPEG